LKKNIFLWVIMPVTVFMLLGAFLFVISKPYNLDGTSEIRNVTVLSEIKVPVGSLQQGILACNGYYSSNHQTLTMFDHDWNIIRARQMRFDGISRPHIGILSCSESGDIIAGVIDLDAYENGKRNTRIVLINPESFRVERAYDFSPHSKYVDAIVQYQGDFWVSYRNFITVYAVNEFDKLIKTRRYKIISGTAQGLRITQEGLYVVPENNLARIRGLSNGIYRYPFDSINEYDETLWNNVLSAVEMFASSIEYRFDLGVVNRFFAEGMNYPDVIWEFGFPVDRPDNEGFSFDPEIVEHNRVWISDVNGDTARNLILH